MQCSVGGMLPMCRAQRRVHSHATVVAQHSAHYTLRSMATRITNTYILGLKDVTMCLERALGAASRVGALNGACVND